jgi:hypothetical protein
MRKPFLSDEWFTEVEQLIEAAGDLQIPDAMKIEVNVTITSSNGAVPLSMKDGKFARGHNPAYATSLTLADDIARKIFVDGDAAAGVQAFLEGKIQVEGDLAKVVAMQTVEPSAQQLQLTRKIAAMTA